MRSTTLPGNVGREEASDMGSGLAGGGEISGMTASQLGLSAC